MENISSYQNIITVNSKPQKFRKDIQTEINSVINNPKVYFDESIFDDIWIHCQDGMIEYLKEKISEKTDSKFKIYFTGQFDKFFNIEFVENVEPKLEKFIIQLVKKAFKRFDDVFILYFRKSFKVN